MKEAGLLSWYLLSFIQGYLFGLDHFRRRICLLFILRFATLLFTKIFHWIIGDRVEFMDQTEPSRQFHLKMVSIMILFLIVDVAMLWSAIQTTLLVGPSMFMSLDLNTRY
jgi:E3 ubiquitin-protein ligase synoviolin